MKRILFSMMCAGVCAGAMAIPAVPGTVKYTQPDGTEIELRVVGDEHGHVVYSYDGKILVDVDGRLEYARFDKSGMPVASGIMAGDRTHDSETLSALQSSGQVGQWLQRIAEHKASKLDRYDAHKMNKSAAVDEEVPDEAGSDRLVPLNYGRCESTFPVIGEQKGLVVLVEYQDLSFTFGDFDYFNRMLNEEGFSDFGSLGSARDWFIYNSGGQFLPDFDVYGPVLLPEKRAYYGGNDVFGNDKNPQEMAIHALQILDEDVDFSQYDRDGDGVIDNVFVFFAGKGEHDSGLSNAVWPHSWDVATEDPDKEFVFDGVRLNHYACTCEYPNGYKRPDGIGTFIHEFSHVMGLPDLYVTDYSGGFTPGEWSVLDVGPYNNDRLTPPNYSSFEKCALGWMEMLPLEQGHVEIPNFAETDVAYALPTENSNEFYFFENRQQVGNDEFIPGHGMLVWHIDYQKRAWDMNIVNNTTNHQLVDIVEADNRKTERTRSGDSFPGTANVTEFTFETTPQLASWNKNELALDIKNISESADGIISFDAESRGNGGAVDILSPAETGEKVYFDLLGRKVIHPAGGVYISDGKKIMVK